jgi:hypothetical protein
MSILNRPSDGLVSVLVALRRTLVTYGSLSEARLLALCAPESVVGEKRDMAKKTLTRWRQLGLFVAENDEISLAPEVRGLELDDLERFRRAVLECVLRESNNPMLTTAKDADDQEGSLASDATRAAAWVLSQSTTLMPATWSRVEAVQAEQGIKPRAFANDTRWHGFVEWASFLGLIVKAGRTLVPNPARALRGVLPDVFGGVRELSQEAFFARIAAALPVVDGGKYREQVEASVERPWRTTAMGEVSPSLSVALQQLESSGELLLESRSDAPHRRFLGGAGNEVRRVSHLILAGGNS